MRVQYIEWRRDKVNHDESTKAAAILLTSCRFKSLLGSTSGANYTTRMRTQTRSKNTLPPFSTRDAETRMSMQPASVHRVTVGEPSLCNTAHTRCAHFARRKLFGLNSKQTFKSSYTSGTTFPGPDQCWFDFVDGK